MQKRLMRTSSVAIITGMFVSALQTCLLYFLDTDWPVLPLACVLDLLICIFLLENSFSYRVCLRYMIVTELLSLTVGVTAWFQMYGSFLPYSSVMLWLYLIHLAVPFLYCTGCYLMDYGPRFMHYLSFFYTFSLILWVSLIAGFLFCYVYKQPALGIAEQPNLIPFYTLSSVIEAGIQTHTSLRPTILYLVQYAAFFIPVGFYLHLFYGRHLIVLRILSFLLVPAAIELAQYFFRPSMCEIDDLLPALIGCFLGSILYTFLNRVCLALHDEPFLRKKDRRSFYLS